jgi:mannitol/fructose-specific phosphotransferase system IIA component (Ntr-type)
MSPDADPTAGSPYPMIDVPESEAGSRESVVRFLVGELAATCGVAAGQLDDVVRSVLRRETLGTTGIGQGMAIPHARSEAVAAVGVLIGRLPVPVEWDAIDAEPVRLACLLLAPRDTGVPRPKHLEGLVRFLRDYSAGDRGV